jgi:RNA polymerase sigma-70 factor (ECF subfamily)
MISTTVTRIQREPMEQKPAPDPAAWLDLYGDYLYGYALVRLRNASHAEDVVQETLLAALQSHDRYAGRSSERTWLIGILKHKLIDHFRRVGREAPVGEVEGEVFEHPELFRESGEWVDHWKEGRSPIEWQMTPAAMLEQTEFWETFNSCLSPLPARIASAFTLREIDGLSTEEICEILNVSTNNLWVMLHRARMHLRRCIELNWFGRKPVKH